MENLDLKLDPNNVIEIGEDEFNSIEKQINNDCKCDCDAPTPKTLDKFYEEDLKTEYVKVAPMVKRAYCPECGKEIISRGPVMYNPFSFEKTCPHVCDCGWRGDLEYAYPRVVFVMENGTQIEAYAK